MLLNYPRNKILSMRLRLAQNSLKQCTILRLFRDITYRQNHVCKSVVVQTSRVDQKLGVFKKTYLYFNFDMKENNGIAYVKIYLP